MESRPGELPTTAGRDRTTLVRRRRSNRPGNSQAKGPDGRRHSGKRRAGCPFTEGVTAALACGRNLSGLGTEGARTGMGPVAAHRFVSGTRDLAETAAATSLGETVFAERHRALGARMVPFGGYEMPVQYPTGILAEHAWT